MTIKCPKCGHERGPGEKAPAWQCPSCGAVYAKVMKREPQVANADWDPPKPLSPPPPVRQNVTVAFPDELSVKVIDIKMPFWSMVGFMVKWAIASIPAFLILFVIGIFVFSLLGGVGHSLRV